MDALNYPNKKSLSNIELPALGDIRKARKKLGNLILMTPVWPSYSSHIKAILGEEAQLFFKFELWQYAGTFKPRGALLSIMNLNEKQRSCGVTAASAGNHAIAVSYAAKVFNVSAKVVMPKTASLVRVEKCHMYGAEVVFAKDMYEVFEKVEKIQKEEGRQLVHPFEGPTIALGTATLGLEVCEQIANLEAVVMAVGGGGLIGGVAAAVKQINPHCAVFGVEPRGAATMSQSFASGQPAELSKINTIADSLSVPNAQPYSFNLCSRYVDAIALVSDAEIKNAMGYLFDELKLACEPACATALAGVFGPLREKLINKRACVILCGSNTDPQTLADYLSK